MQSRIVTLVTLLFLAGNVIGQTDEAAVDSSLRTLQDVTVISKLVRYHPFSLEYLLSVKQPIDHGDTTKGFFYQQLRLLHTGFSKPMIMETEGYNGTTPYCELQKMLGANDIDIEFRYFNKSRPDSLQWQYLTFEQAVEDLHHINKIFRKLYYSKWISTGISRGGETTLIYRYYYPQDVAVSVPYVAPMPNDIEDKRIYAFLDTAGGPSCVKKIRNVQKYLLLHEKEAIQKIPPAEKSLHYSSVGGIGGAFEYVVLEYPFSFWQISTLTEKDIPTNNNLDSILAHLYKIFGSYISSFSDEQNEMFVPHYYMTYQTGYYKYNISPFVNYLHYLKGSNPTAAFLPPKIPRKNYDPGFAKRINEWLALGGSNILYIYGGRDTWTACAATVISATNSKIFVIPGLNHNFARIRNMPTSMQRSFGDAFEKMLALKADFSVLTSDK